MNVTQAISKTTATHCRERVSAFVATVRGARSVPVGNGHLSLEIGGRRFGWLLDDHHGDGRVALHLKAPKGARERLMAYAPHTFHVPKHLGRHGWIGVWLDTPAPDWTEVGELIQSASELTGAGRRANHHRTITNKHSIT